MTEIALIRPGATQFDLEGRIQGTLDIPLSDEGNREVACLVDQLRGQPIQAIYTSPCSSATQTAEALAEALDVRCKTLESLRNLDHGLWQGRCIDEVKATQPRVYRQWQAHPDNVCPPRGEPLAAARQRVEEAFSRLLKKHKHEKIAVAAPEPLASLIHSHLLEAELPNLWKACACHAGCEWITARPRSMAAVR